MAWSGRPATAGVGQQRLPGLTGRRPQVWRNPASDFVRRQASEQYFTCAQFFAHRLRQVISRPQVAQGLLGSEALLPL